MRSWPEFVVPWHTSQLHILLMFHWTRQPYLSIRVGAQQWRVLRTPFFELSVQHDSGVGLIQPCPQKVQKTVEVPQFEVISAAVANQLWMKQADKQLNEQDSQEKPMTFLETVFRYDEG